jgi:hypothetical protein
MTEDKYLPIVNAEIGLPIAHALRGQDDDNYVHEELAKINKENPVIVEFLQQFAETTEDEMGSLFAGILIYKMLRSQAEADRMKQEIALF